MAGTGTRGDQFMPLQGGLIEKAMGKSKTEMEKSNEIREGT